MMKTTIKFLSILISLLVITACSKDDEPMNEAPKAFTVTPIVTGNSATINWSEAIDPEGRTITYNVEMNGQTIASNETITSYTFSDLTYATTFTGKVIAYDDEGLTSEASFSFETEMRPNTAPTAAVLSAPSANEQSVSVTAELTWTAATDAENDAIVYDVYLDESSNPTTKIAENLTNTSYQLVTQLSNQTNYYWKVIARDTFDAETESAVGSFVTRDLVVAAQSTANAPWVARAYHTSLVFDNKMWIIGGGPNNNGAYKDVWYSIDGENWTQTTDNAAFGDRKIHASVVFDNKMWVIGGLRFSHSAGNELGDVWYSTDGIEWILAIDNAFPGRFVHEAVVFDGKMWVIGGRDFSNNVGISEVWSSSDGVNWAMDSSNVNLGSTTASFTVNEFNGKLWKLGGNDQRIYSSSNGINWVLESETCPMGNRLGHSTVVYDNKMWLISGVDHLISVYNEIPDVWFTEDGINWQLASANAGFRASWAHSSVVYDDKMWIIGGGGGFGSFTSWNEVWSLQY